MIQLYEIQQLAVALIASKENEERIEDELKTAKETTRRLSEETIPCAMQEVGLKEFKLETGEGVSCKDDVYASISAANKAAAFRWLDEKGFGGLIKTDVSVQFGRDGDEAAQKLEQELQAMGLLPEVSRAVNAQTLKAFLREQLAKGEEGLPLDLFGARPVTVTTIKKPAVKKAKA